MTLTQHEIKTPTMLANQEAQNQSLQSLIYRIKINKIKSQYKP